MAKELPYFKFEPNQWENGNIQMCSREEKGLFVDLCSMYWSRVGDLPFKLAVQKLCAGNANALDSLLENEIIENIDGDIYIKFLSEQLQEFKNTSQKNSKTAKEAWEKRKNINGFDAGVMRPHSERNAIRGEKIKEEEIIKEYKGNIAATPLPKKSLEDKILDCDQRESKFKDEVSLFDVSYETEMLNKFINYWVERTKDRTKMKWEKKETFEISRRLVTWSGNNNKFKQNSNGPTFTNKAEREQYEFDRQNGTNFSGLFPANSQQSRGT